MSEHRRPTRGERPEAAPSFEEYGGSAPENYERYFVPSIGGPLAAQLIERASLRPGERVLDVACGTGVVARLAAEGVGPAGSVAGLDINPGMLAVARSATPADTTIDWHQASADDTSMPDGTFDVVLCQMGLQFFPDKSAALREMRRVLAPGGRVVLNLPGPAPQIFTILADGLARHIAPELAGFVNVVFSLHDLDEVRDLLDQAGFDDVSVEATVRTLELPAPTAFLWQYVHSTPLADGVGRVDDDRRAALEREVVAGWEPFTRDGGLVGDVRIVEAIARKP
jgi:ubiquinone/menaquinone biosynthesis C-methylase UbiE